MPACQTAPVAVPLDFDYTLVRPKQRCPFLVSPGFLAGPPRLLKSLYEHLRVVEPQTRKYLDNYFTGHVSLAFAVERGLLPVLALPARYNFPDSPAAARLYPDEFKNVILMHYVNTRHFDPKRIFTSEVCFDYFMSQPLFGRNKLFQEHVRELTGGVYPFLS